MTTIEDNPSTLKAVERGRFGEAQSALREKFPARAPSVSWPATQASMDEVVRRLAQRPFTAQNEATTRSRCRGVRYVLAWLEAQPGDTWQERWTSTGAERLPREGWLDLPRQWFTRTHGLVLRDSQLSPGLLMLICGDVIRPTSAWLLSRTSQHLGRAMASARDLEGFERLSAQAASDKVPSAVLRIARHRIAVILASNGGGISDITVGDCVNILEAQDVAHAATSDRTAFYRLLHKAGVFPPDAPSTIRAFTAGQGQLSVAEMIDRYEIACKPVRDLFVDYLCERQAVLDYTSLAAVSRVLGSLFWRDLETHHPGIDSLRLLPEVASAWKTRHRTKTTKVRRADGSTVSVTSPRESARSDLTTVRAFYLDLAQWAAEDPARWGPWAAPSPVTSAEANQKKHQRRVKAKMDQRTRERLPVLPLLVSTSQRNRLRAAALLAAARQAEPGTVFSAEGQRLFRPVLKSASGARVWAQELEAPRTAARAVRRDLTHEEHKAFWAWAAVEVLRHTGIRIEELCELSHHSLIQYRLPTTGELVPLLQIAPSKTDQERLILVTPELADVLSRIIMRVRDSDGIVASVAAYDPHERVWNPPMPLLFQHRIGIENRAMHPTCIRTYVTHALADTGLTDASGEPLTMQPHDFRRIFITDAVMNGMPPHIAQLVAGHRVIDTTMGYLAVYPREVIEAHRAFIARRRASRPSEEYRTPTDEEWDSFLGHFEKRKLSIGTCGRAFSTPCIHEHACLRCAILRPDPAERPRLIEIRDNLIDRIAEAKREGWLGEVEGLETSLAGANDKLVQMDAATARAASAVDLGMPTFNQIAGRATDT
ncbi:tyrosine-type recombinase/integrase (plasmid) [Streptomyces sp. HUAS TT11]|uniref:tyrosine-type recombinase/integrase n=1 Tax=Streptomyces sp. HUAS TT11 TaxID=3447508 RepID=UPI003F657974